MNRQQNRKNMIIMFALLIPGVIWFALKLAGCYAPDIELFSLLERLTESLNYPLDIEFNEYSLKTVLVFLLLYAMGIGIYFSSSEKRRPGEEHGSAEWGSVSALARKYTDKSDKFNNLILSQSMRLGLNAKKHRRNLNVLVVGGSGAGKTRFYAKPNILQCNSSFVVADPKGGATRFCTNTIL